MVKITADAEPDLRARFARGETCLQIAAAYGCSDSTISKRLRDMGLDPSEALKGRRSRSDEVKEKIKALWLEGQTALKIGEQFGMSRAAVCGMVHRQGWERPCEVAVQNSRSAKKRPRTDSAKKARPPELGIAVNGALFEKAPGAKMPSLRAVTSTGVPARICDEHFTRRGCKWPIGTPAAGFADEQMFCNGARAEAEARYCPEHLALAFCAKQPKRKTNPPPLGGGLGYRYGERRFG